MKVLSLASQMDIKLIRNISLLLLAFLSFEKSCGQVIVNEFICSNTSGFLSTETGQFSDWIELYNTDSQDVNLDDYFLTDKKDQLDKWSFPANTIIPGNGFLLVYPDKLNQGLHTNFGLSRDGESIYLTGPDGSTHDAIDFGKQKADVSYGRNVDNPSEWGWYSEPTPGEENYSHWYNRPTENLLPALSPEAGFYSGPIEVVLENTGEDIILCRYTTDGSIPSSSSPIFPRILTLEKTTIVRIRAFSADNLPGKVLAKTYFIDEESTLPVFSISVDPEYLWDEETGIYVDGSDFDGERSSRNCCQTDWERPINIEFFEKNGQLMFSEQAGVQVKGRMNCEFPKKPLGIYFRSKYGNNHVDYPFFKEKPIVQFSSFILRPGGADGMGDCYNGTMIRDGLLSTLLVDQMDIDYEGYTPAVLFINGEYWGIHNIRERNKADYLATNHGVDPDNLDLLENPANGGIIKGDDLHYMGLLNLVRSGEVKYASGLNKVKELIDLQELLNYQIAEIFVNNEDWAHNNVLCWRPRTVDGKWRWVFFDVEGGFGLYHANDYTNNLFGYQEDNFLQHAYLFRNLLTNPSIKSDFIQGFAAHLNTTFRTERVIRIIDSLSTEIAEEMPNDVARWSGHTTAGGSGCSPISSIDQWDEHLEIMKEFARQRPDIIRQQIISRYNLSGMAELSLEANGGSISIGGVENASSGLYFKDMPIRMQAIPNTGYQFVGWENISSLAEISVNLIHDTLIRAVFIPNGGTILPDTINTKMILNDLGSPYLVNSDLIVEEGGILILNPGVQILMPENASIYVYGQLQVMGKSDNPVKIEGNPADRKRWGALVFDHSEDGSEINHLELSRASLGHKNPLDFKANLSIINSFVRVTGLKISDASTNPVFVKGARASISHSVLHSTAICDYINVAESSGALIEFCDFLGDQAPDTDAIDLDAVGLSFIRYNKFKNFQGLNSDGLDIGYSDEIIIEGNIFSNISDKGISVGMNSHVQATGNIFLNCNAGIAVKDEGSIIDLDRNTFYSNKIGVSCFEKEPGRGGGSAHILNSIFAGGEQQAGMADVYSSISFDYTWNELEVLPGQYNQSGDPGFISARNGAFRLSHLSGCRESGDPQSPLDPDGSRADLGAYYFHNQQYFDVYINEIILNADEFQVEIYNKDIGTIDSRELVLSSTGNFWDEINLGAFLDADPYLAPNEFRVFKIPTGLLSPNNTGDILLLSQIMQEEKILLSSIPVTTYLTSHSIGCFPDGSYQIRHFSQATPGWSNQAEASGEGQIFINEVLANNQHSITNEANQNEDWLEIYNAGTEEYMLGGLYLTDNLNNPTKHQIPASLKNNPYISSRGFSFFWADGDPDAGADHLNFKLDADQEEVGLFRIIHPDTLLIDSLLFVNQIPDRSFGRYPDGSSNLREFGVLTPGQSNVYLYVSDTQNIFDLTIFPNPCRDRLNITVEGILSNDARLDLINLNGQTMSTVRLSNMNPGTTSIPVNHLPPGMYIVRVISSNSVKTARIIKE